jgi:RimJ/RimL family protein N-acetyltransferase
MTYQVKPLTAGQVRTFISWQYDGPYALYNLSAENEEEDVRFFLDAQNGYFAIASEEGEFLGFCNFGADARVPGGDYSLDALDIGMGMRPDLTGQGQGVLYAAAVFDFARQHYNASTMRVTIAEFNQRAQQLCRNFGFEQISRFVRAQDERPFVVMVWNWKLND